MEKQQYDLVLSGHEAIIQVSLETSQQLHGISQQLRSLPRDMAAAMAGTAPPDDQEIRSGENSAIPR